MKVLVGGEKGGSGKTTIATNIASAIAKSGKDVLIVDCDPQGSSAGWGASRAKEIQERAADPSNKTQMPNITCVRLTGSGIQHQINELSKRYETIIMDAGGRDSVELRSAMMAADIMVSPLIPSDYDIWTVEKLNALVTMVKPLNPELKTFIVLSKASTNAFNGDTEEARSALESFDSFAVCNTVIRERMAYRKAVGQGVVESKLDKKATDEINSLVTELGLVNGKEK